MTLSIFKKSKVDKEILNREKADISRFGAEKKQLVVIAEGAGQHKYFAPLLRYIIENSDVTVHYITCDPDDPVFSNKVCGIKYYYIGMKALVSVMLRMNADIVLMTTPDLGNFQLRRSAVRRDIEYIFLDHCFASFHLMYRAGALDHFDTVFCYGKNHELELRALEKMRGTPKKRVIETGYFLLDSLIEAHEHQTNESEQSKKQIIVAPSWQKGNLFEECLPALLDQFSGSEYKVILRPHPEYIRKNPGAKDAILEKVSQFGSGFSLQTDFCRSDDIYGSDLLITDWSAVWAEFSFVTGRPCIFVDTPMKVLNPDWQKVEPEPVELSFREKVGARLLPEQLSQLKETAEKFINGGEEYRAAIDELKSNFLFNIGNTAKVGGEYVLQRLSGK